jgi:hypothetical protein
MSGTDSNEMQGSRGFRRGPSYLKLDHGGGMSEEPEMNGMFARLLGGISL